MFDDDEDAEHTGWICFFICFVVVNQCVLDVAREDRRRASCRTNVKQIQPDWDGVTHKVLNQGHVT